MVVHIKKLKHTPFHFKHKKKHWIIPLIILVVLVILFIYIVGSTKNYDDFAKCLADKGAVLYVADNCIPCENQKAMFGDSAQYLKTEKCESVDECKNKGIEVLPSWIIEEQTLKGKQSLEKLGEVSGCSLR